MAFSDDGNAHEAAGDSRTPSVALRPFGREDFDRLIFWIDSPETMRDWAAGFFTYPLTGAQLEAYQEGAVRGERRLFTVIDDLDGRPVGHIELAHIVPFLSGFVSRVLVGDAHRRGRGLGEQMVRRLAAIAFEEHGLHHLYLGVVKTNAAATRCYAKIGFRYVSEWPDAMQTPAGTVTVAWMLLNRTDWERRGPG